MNVEEEKASELIDKVGKGIWGSGKDLLRLTVFLGFLAGAGVLGWHLRGNYISKQKPYWDIVEIKQVGTRVGVYIDRRFQPHLFYDEIRSEDPNAEVFTSKHYRDNLSNQK